VGVGVGVGMEQGGTVVREIDIWEIEREGSQLAGTRNKTA
jgi:hypothetical protein